MDRKAGFKVICTKDGWRNGNNVSDFRAPKLHETVMIRDVKIYEGVTLLSFYNYPADNYYPSKFFKQLDYDFVERVIEQVKPRFLRG